MCTDGRRGVETERPRTGRQQPGRGGCALLDMEGCPWWALLHGKAGHGRRVPNAATLQNSLTLSPALPL